MCVYVNAKIDRVCKCPFSHMHIYELRNLHLKIQLINIAAIPSVSYRPPGSGIHEILFNEKY